MKAAEIDYATHAGCFWWMEEEEEEGDGALWILVNS